MANISTGLKKRGSRNLYEGNYKGAVECFSRVCLMQPDDTDNIIDLIYALNQNADYIKALTYCYSLLGEYERIEKKDTLYFLLAEAFGGVGCAECCAQMLEKCLLENPEGPSSKDAQAFLKDLKQKYQLEKYDTSTDCVSMPMPNNFMDAPFLNYETLICMKEVSLFINEKKYTEAMERIEKELDTGNVTVSLLALGMMLGAESGDAQYIKRNAERFRFVEDYTTQELHSLAYGLNELNDDDIAYTVYRELYSKESGDRDIAFGFAVACERIGDFSHAKEIASNVLSFDGGRGPASYYINEIGSRNHSYLLRYEGKCEEDILKNIEAGFCEKGLKTAEAVDYLHFAEIKTGLKLIDVLDTADLFSRIELRRGAIDSKINLVLRARCAARVFESGRKVFLNTGSDIIEFTPEIEKVINNFFERGQHETID